MNKAYSLYIKSHCAFPDWEMEISAKNKKEAVEFFYKQLRGEFDKKFIAKELYCEKI